MSMRGGEHDADRGRVEEHDDAQLEEAEVVPQHRREPSCLGYSLDHAHAGRLSIVRRESASLPSARGSISSARASTPAQTSVAIATCSPLKKAASVNAA